MLFLVIKRKVQLCGTARGGDSAGTWQVKFSGQLLCWCGKLSLSKESTSVLGLSDGLFLPKPRPVYQVMDFRSSLIDLLFKYLTCLSLSRVQMPSL